MRHSVTAAMKQKIAAKAKSLPASFALANFRVVDGHNVALVTLATSNATDTNLDELKKSFDQRFEQKVVLVEGSFNHLASYNGKNFFSALARENTVSKEYDVSKMSCIATDTFLDEDENSIWRSVGNGDSRRLVLQSSDDFEKLLASRRQVMTSPELVMASTLQNGQYVMFYSPVDDEMKFGYGFMNKAGYNVVERSSEEVVMVNPDLIVETASGLDDEYQVTFDNKGLLTTAMDAASSKRLVDYFKKLYKGTAFFVKLEKIIKNSRN